MPVQFLKCQVNFAVLFIKLSLASKNLIFSRSVMETSELPINSELLASIEDYVTSFFKEHIKMEFVYHDLEHTQYVVDASYLIGKSCELTEEEMEVVGIAAWFHDTGYNQGQENHEERSCEFARQFLLNQQYPVEKLNKVLGCIRATKLPQNPQTLLEEIICDADLSHLGTESYWDRCGRIRQELLMTKNIVMSEQEWVDFELDFITNHHYHTEAAGEIFNKRKERHIRQLRKQKLRLNPKLADLIADPVAPRSKAKKKKKKKRPKDNKGNSDLELKQMSLGRGVETMYRTTYRTHVNLSSIADNKANIMLSVNAIILSIIASSLIPEIFRNGNTTLLYPTVVLITVCLTALTYAILATRPKVTEGKFTREDIQKKRSNLLFFGNFYNMDINDFHWGMMQMIKDSDFLYSSMTRDLYYLGVVLAKKYRYLRICYTIFMYGLILSMLAFVITYATSAPTANPPQ